MDAVFVRPGGAELAQVPLAQAWQPPGRWQRYANNPLRAKQNQELGPQLKRHLREQLPDYMVPSSIVMLDHVPLSASGKLDRRALAALATPPPLIAAPADAAPATALEQALAAIWTDLLGIPNLPTTANFFDLGGHSLLATQLVSRIARQLGLETPLRTVFENPTLSTLAEAIVACEGAPGEAMAAASLMVAIEGMSSGEVAERLKEVG
jgi:acyl carrier protein